MQQEQSLAKILRLARRGSSLTIWLVFQLFIWIVAFRVAESGWLAWSALFLSFAGTAYLAQVFQEPALWSSRFRNLAQPVTSGFWRCQIGQVAANVLMAGAFLWLVNRLIIQVWDLDVTPFLVMYGLGSSIQCLRWRRDDRASFGHKTPAVFFELARDMIRWFRHRNDPAQDGIAVPGNCAFLDQARSRPAEAGQDPSHLQ